jgi:hypothetical protein
MKDIVFSSTTQLAAAIRTGEVSATEVLEALYWLPGTSIPETEENGSE